MHDVVVIGGGPVGSHIAGKLAEMGHGVVVLEQRPRIGTKLCCTGIISQECAASFSISSDVILRQANSAKLFSPSGNSIRLHREATQAYIVDRPAFDRAMAARAKSEGAVYHLNHRAESIVFEDKRVTIETACDSKRSHFRTRAAVIASGSGSPLVRKLGLGQISDSVAGAQAQVATHGLEEVEVYFGEERAPGFFAWLVPTSPKTGLVGLLSRRSPTLYLRKLLASLAAQGKIASTDVDIHRGVIPLKPLPKTYGDRLLVVGDAAGQVKPTTGGGIYFGLLCADIAANTLHQALEADDLSAQFLSAYQRRWRRKLGRELTIDYFARRVYEMLSDGQVDRFFNIIKSNAIVELLSRSDLPFDWNGEALLQIWKHGAISRAMKLMKLPGSLVRR